MRHHILRSLVLCLFVVAAIVGPAIATSTLAAGSGGLPRDSHGRLEVGGIARTYDIHFPPAFDGHASLPAVLALHGGVGTGEGMARLTHFNDVSNRQGFVVVYPNAIQSRWADGRGTTSSERTGIDDVGFLSALVTHLATEFHVDARRIYATGISNGGFMVGRFACERADRIAAVAQVAATMAEPLAGRCHPARAVPMLFIHGSRDHLVPWQGGSVPVGAGGRILSVPATVAMWAKLNGCAPAPTQSALVQRGAVDPTVQREVYRACAEGAEVVLLAIDGGGHTWPGGIQYLPEWVVGWTYSDLDASEVIWEFFRAYPKR